MSKKEKFIFVILGLVSFFLVDTYIVNADTISGTSTKYYYANKSDVTSTTAYRTNPSSIEIYGMENYSPTYDDYEYLTGFLINIPMNITNGNVYTITVNWSASSWSNSDFSTLNFSNRMKGLMLTGAVNGVISYQDTSYYTNNAFTYSGSVYYTYNFTTTYTFTAISTSTYFRVGTYNTNAYSLFGDTHYLLSLVQVHSVDVILNSDNTIINQNEQILSKNDTIINQNQQTNERLDNVNSSIKETNDILNDDDTSESVNEANSFFSGFSTDTFGLTSIITSPLTLIGSITSSTCSPLSLKIPFLEDNNTLNLPCMSSIYEENFGSFLTIYQTITFGITAYWVCVRIFALVKDFKNPEEDKIEVLDL